MWWLKVRRRAARATLGETVMLVPGGLPRVGLDLKFDYLHSTATDCGTPLGSLAATLGWCCGEVTCVEAQSETLKLPLTDGYDILCRAGSVWVMANLLHACISWRIAPAVRVGRHTHCSAQCTHAGAL